MPVDPYELLGSTFTDIADAIRYRESRQPQYTEETTKNTSELRNIILRNTGEGPGSNLLNYLVNKYPRRCLMTNSIIKNYGSYSGPGLFIISSISSDLYNTNISITANNGVLTIANNNSYDISVVAYGMQYKTYGNWNQVIESGYGIQAGSSKSYSGNYSFTDLTYFSNTILVPLPTDIGPRDFAKRISSSIQTRSLPNLNSIFTDVANAIRYEQGTSDLIAVPDMPTLIRNL